MYKILFVTLAFTISVALCRPQGPRPLSIPGAAPAPLDHSFPPARNLNIKRIDDEDDLASDLAAKYEFSSNIEDHIADLTNQRSEVRDNGAVQGSYSYSDGYTKRTVHYVADQNGYRVLRMEAEPLNSAGPQVDLSGRATISNAAHGTLLNYSIQSVPTGHHHPRSQSPLRR